MRQDNDLIRKMILAVEDHEHGYAPGDLGLEGYTAEQVGYHAYLLHDAGLAVCSDMTTLGSKSPRWRVMKLTTKGHEFAAAARTQYLWDEAREEINAKGLAGATLDMLKQLLDRKLRKKLLDE